MNLDRALLYLYSAFEHAQFASARTVRLLHVAIAKFTALMAIAQAAA